MSPLWEMVISQSGRQHQIQIDVHKKYGSVVRIAPNTILVDDSQYFPAIFEMPRSNFWIAFRASPEYTPHALEMDPAKHLRQKKQVIGAYSMSSILRNEHKVDKHIQILTDKLRTKVGQTIDFAPWAQWFAFDIVMEVVFSNPLDCVGTESDINGIIASIHSLFASGNLPPLNPWLARFLLTPWIHKRVTPQPGDETGPGQIHGLAYEQVRRRLQSDEKFGDVSQSIIDKNGGDLPRLQLEQESIGPVLAGSDTVAVFLRAAMMYLVRNSSVLGKLQHEIDTAAADGHLSTVAQYNEIRNHTPYAELVIKETMRIYSSIESVLPRKASADGITIEGYFIPAETTVGISHRTVSRNEKVFHQPETFQPERWLDRSLDAAFIAFHKGSMTCTGQHIAMVGASKLLVQLFRIFDFKLVNPDNPWKAVNKMAMLHWDYFVRVSERNVQV